MISWSDALLALCFWVVTFYLFRPSALREQAWSDRRSFAPRLLALCLAVSLSFQVDPLAAAFDSLVGLRNLSWLLAYLNAVAAAYAGVLTLVVMGQRKMPQSVNILTVATLLALMVFFTALMRSGEELHNHFPTSASALGFREILYVSLALQLIFAIRIQWGLLEREELPTGKLRGWMVMSALLAALVFFNARGVAAYIAFLIPEWSLYGPALSVSGAFVTFAIIGLALSFAPRSWWRVPVQALARVRQLMTLRDLERFRKRLIAVTAPLPWSQPSFRERWQNTPYALYCTLIDILDRRLLLQAIVENREARVTPAHLELAQLLETVPDTHDWVELVEYIRKVARHAV